MNTLAKPLTTNQKGFILITTLVLLVMITIIGMAQISMNSTQTKVTANTTDIEINYEKTEGALNEAINKLIKQEYDNEDFANNTNGLYLCNSNAAPTWKTLNWDSAASVIPSFQGLSGKQASYIVVQLPSVAQPGQNMKTLTRIYRVTSRSVAQSGLSSVMLQNTVQIQN